MSTESANAVTDHPLTGPAQGHSDAPDNPSEREFDRGLRRGLNRISIAILLALAIAFIAAVQSATGLSESTRAKRARVASAVTFLRSTLPERSRSMGISTSSM